MGKLTIAVPFRPRRPASTNHGHPATGAGESVC
jgi:hypothetical protein